MKNQLQMTISNKILYPMYVFNIIVLATCFISAESSQAQVNFVENISWDAAKELSVKARKPIFIDFYTTWCGPCKKMDKSTFQDTRISHLMNNNFINLKVDAEDPMYKNLVTQFEVISYPTYIFAKSNGDLVSKETGYRLSEDFEKVCNKLLTFLNDDPLSKLSTDKVEQLSDEEIENILNDYSNYNFGLKESLKKNAYDKLKNNNPITIAEYEFLLCNYKPNDQYHLLLENAPEKLTMMNRPKWNKRISELFIKLYKQAIADDDEEQLNEITKKYSAASEGPLKSLSYFKNTSKEIKTQRLNFYKDTGDYNRYFHVADTLINEYMLPINPKDIQRQDKYMAKLMMNIMNSKDVMEGTKTVPRDSIVIKHPSSSMLTYRLNEIVENIVHNFDEYTYLSKAQEWIALSIAFIDLPESHLIKAAIFKKEGLIEKCQSEIEIAKSSIYFDKKCTDLMEKFKL